MNSLITAVTSATNVGTRVPVLADTSGRLLVNNAIGELPVNLIVLASGARTTTQTQADQTNVNYKGIHLIVDMTVVGTGSITPALQGKDANGIYYPIWTAAVAITTNITSKYALYPGATGVGAQTEAVAIVLPLTWRIVITANNANTATYSVAACLLP